MPSRAFVDRRPGCRRAGRSARASRAGARATGAGTRAPRTTPAAWPAVNASKCSPISPAPGRHAARRGTGRRRLRPAAHRVPVPGARHRARRSRAARQLPAGRGPARRPAAGDPHARHRRRQAHRLSTACRRRRTRRSGLRGIRTSLWRPELLDVQLRALLAVRPGGAHPAAHDHRRRARSPQVRQRLDGRCARELGVPRAAARRDDRNAGRGHARGPDRARGRLPVHRHQRSGAVRTRHGSRPRRAGGAHRRRASRRCCGSSRPRRAARPCTAGRSRCAAAWRPIRKRCRCC